MPPPPPPPVRTGRIIDVVLGLGAPEAAHRLAGDLELPLFPAERPHDSGEPLGVADMLVCWLDVQRLA